MQVALTLLVSAVQIYEVYLIYQCFFDKSKVSGKCLFAGYLFLYVFLSTECLVVNIPIINSLSCFCGLFGMTLFYEEIWKNRLVAFFFNYGAMFAAEAIVSALFGYVNVGLFIVREYYSYFGMVVLPLVQFLIVLIVRNFKNLRRKEVVTTSYWVISLVLPILSIYLYIQILTRLEMSKVNLFFCIFSILVINILVIFLYDRQIKASVLEREKEVLELQNVYQERQYELINESVERIKEQQHDFRNHLNAIYYFGQNKDWKALKMYVDELRERTVEAKQFVNTGNIIFDGVLNYKLQKAEQEKIHMDLDVLIPTDIEIEPCDITIILGNLLDNSIEATKGKSDSWIRVKILYRLKRLNIIVTNTYSNELVYQGDFYQTSKQDKKKHGYGMRNIKEVVDRYDGIMDTNADNGVFTVTVSLFL